MSCRTLTFDNISTRADDDLLDSLNMEMYNVHEDFSTLLFVSRKSIYNLYDRQYRHNYKILPFIIKSLCKCLINNDFYV